MKNSKIFDVINIIADILFILFLFYGIYFLPNNTQTLTYFGFLNLIFSITMIIRFWKKKNISLLIGILMFINISYSSSVCFFALENARNWQTHLVNLPANIINIKNYTLFIMIATLIISKIKNINYTELKIKKDKYVFFFGFVFLIYALLFGIDRSVIGIYISNTNVLYEYAIVVYIFCWLYHGNNKVKRNILITYAFLYTLQALAFGDRSSAFPMILANLMLLYSKKINMKYIIILGLSGIFLANFIDLFRNGNGLLLVSNFNNIISRGLNVNTISYSSYAGTQIVRYSMYNNNGFAHFIDFIFSIILGSSGKKSLTKMATSSGFYNAGGGMSSSYFYYWGGYLYTIIFAVIFGLIIKNVFKKDSELCNILKITITVFSIRWLIYYPIAFFRTAIFVPMVLYFVIKIYNNIFNKKVSNS